MTIITGHDAIEIAEDYNMGLSKYADPTEGVCHCRAELSISPCVARLVATEDPSLVYINTDNVPMVYDGCLYDSEHKLAEAMFADWIEAQGSNDEAEVVRTLVAHSNSSLIGEMKDEGWWHPRFTDDLVDNVIYNYRAGTAAELKGRRVVTVTVEANADIPAGTHRIIIPTSYDETEITAEDIAMDCQIFWLESRCETVSL